MKKRRPVGLLLTLTTVISLGISWQWIVPSHAAQVAEPGPGRYALLIGVNKYDDARAIKRDGNLNFAERDAEQLAEALRGRGFAATDVLVMSTASKRGDEHYPTAANIRRQVKALAGRLREGDSVVVSFSGYEMQYAGDDDYYLCSSDADADDLHTLVSLRGVSSALDRAKGDGKLVIVDSCRGMEKTPGGAPTPKLATRSVGVLFACSKGEIAYETAEKRQGVLSYFIAEGLRGSADIDHDGAISTAELVSYVKGRVPDTQKGQSPELFGPIPRMTFVRHEAPKIGPGASKISGRLLLLSIGINEYPHSENQFRVHRAAPDDARSVQESFKIHSRPLFRSVEARLLLDGQATRGNILESLQWLKESVRSDDKVVVFFAGHGDKQATGQFHILPVDARLEDLRGTGISDDDLKKAIGGLPCTAVLMLDACYSGSFGQKNPKKQIPSKPADVLGGGTADKNGLAILSGTRENQEAMEANGHGFFSQALTQGLGGDADTNSDGVIELFELLPFVQARVRKVSKGAQVPTFGLPQSIESFRLSKP